MRRLLKNTKGNCNKEEKQEEDKRLIFKFREDINKLLFLHIID